MTAIVRVLLIPKYGVKVTRAFTRTLPFLFKASLPGLVRRRGTEILGGPPLALLGLSRSVRFFLRPYRLLACAALSGSTESSTVTAPGVLTASTSLLPLTFALNAFDGNSEA